PEIHHVTAPLRQAARKDANPDLVNLWAGQAHELATDAPAAVVARRLADEARGALQRAGGLLDAGGHSSAEAESSG
ncbi:MAG: hypothetical protein ACRDLN_13295, partial [Solirubrobacteraceae bacterium]